MALIQQFWVCGAVARRLLASLLLVSVIAVFAPSILTHDHASSRDCPQPVSAGIAAFLSTTSPGCDHTLGSACAMMLGCASVAPALVSARVQATPRSTVTIVVSVAASTIQGRLLLGPPTPPPNS